MHSQQFWIDLPVAYLVQGCQDTALDHEGQAPVHGGDDQGWATASEHGAIELALLRDMLEEMDTQCLVWSGRIGSRVYRFREFVGQVQQAVFQQFFFLMVMQVERRATHIGALGDILDRD